MSEERYIYTVHETYLEGPQVFRSLARVTGRQARLIHDGTRVGLRPWSYRVLVPIDEVHFTEEAAVRAWRDALVEKRRSLLEQLADLDRRLSLEVGGCDEQ